MKMFEFVKVEICHIANMNFIRKGFQKLSSDSLSRMQLLTVSRRHDHISPVLKQLHWLPVRRRVEYKLAVLVFKSLQGQTPPCLAEECQLVANSPGRCHLRPVPMSASSRGPVLDWVTEESVSQDRESGTVYPELCDSLTWTLDSFNDC